MRGPRPRSRGVGGNSRVPGACCDLAVMGGVLHLIKYSNYYFSFPCPDPEPGGQGGPGVPPVHAGGGHLHVLVHLRAPRPPRLVSYIYSNRNRIKVKVTLRTNFLDLYEDPTPLHTLLILILYASFISSQGEYREAHLARHFLLCRALVKSHTLQKTAQSPRSK